jgi:hypothetical protein
MKKPYRYWTFERCKEEALKYKSRSEFQLNCIVAYEKSRKKDWLDEICIHMIKIGNYKKRMIYGAIFPDGYAYVGLTYNYEKRKHDHFNKDNSSSIKKHILECGIIPKFFKLTDYIDINIAIQQEHFFYDKLNKRYKMLNQVKCGSIGGTILIWTKEKIHKEALKYNTKKEFSENSPKAYSTAKNNKWLDDTCSHMIPLRKPKGYWDDYKICEDVSKNYNTIKDFQTNNSSAYNSAYNNGWVDTICSHMNTRKCNNYWNFERCKEEAKKFNSRKQFQINSHGAYESARKNGWLDEICSHMKNDKKGQGLKWTKEKCRDEALRYSSRNKFKNDSNGAYSSARKNSWLDEVCLHMK